MTESVADDELAAFVDRILRMKSEEDAIKADIKEIYAEAKGRGYDKTRLGETVATVRKLDKDADGEAEKEAIRDLYLTAYFRSKNKPHTHAYARGAKSTTQNASVPAGFDAETGEEVTTPEITEPQLAPQAGSDLIEAPAYIAGQVADIQPETANEPRITAGHHAPDTGAAGHEPAAGGPAAVNGATLSFADKIKKLRPLCQQPESCRSSGGKNHCYLCMKASAQAVSA